MKATVLLLWTVAIVMAAAIVVAAEDVSRGMWTAEVREGRGELYVNLVRAEGMVFGFELPVGVVGAADLSAESADVTFELRRPAGTVAFEGRFSKGMGAGHFRFTPSAQFVADMQTLGFGGFTEKELLIFAMNDFAASTVRELRTRGYDLSQREVKRAAIFRVTPAVIDEYRRLGFANLAWDDVLKLRMGNVTAAYVNAIRERGYRDATAREIGQMGMFGVTPAYIDSLRAAGYTNLTARQLIKLKQQNVTPEFIRQMNAVR